MKLIGKIKNPNCMHCNKEMKEKDLVIIFKNEVITAQQKLVYPNKCSITDEVIMNKEPAFMLSCKHLIKFRLFKFGNTENKFMCSTCKLEGKISKILLLTNSAS